MGTKRARDIAEAFDGKFNRRCGNAEVTVVDGTTYLYLHGNCIAKKGLGSVSFQVSDGGYYALSVTTKRYLNALPGVQVWTSKFQPYLNGEMWDGSWTTIHR